MFFMKKREYVFLVLALMMLLSVLCSASAAENATNASATTPAAGFDKSYDCLKDKLAEKQYTGMTAEELAFSILAMGYDADIQRKLVAELEKQKSASSDCWPSNGCVLKTTAQVMLAYDHINKNTDGIKNWLMNQTAAPSDIAWYLQLDSNNKSACTITYDNASKKVTIEENKQITGNAGTCFTISDNYWLEVKPICYEKEFKVSCDSDFLISTFYKKKTGSTFFITTSTQTGSPNGELFEKISSVCFKQSGACNYEGSLWATMAVNKKDSSIRNKALPYLLASSQDSANEKYLPSSFLYGLTSFNEYLQELSNEQNVKGYWQVSGDAVKRYYDTAVGLMSLYGGSSEQAAKAAEYLLDPAVQGANGCWDNNIRDIAFLLYTASPKPAVSADSLKPISKCEDFGHTCMLASNCDDVNGTQLPNFYCSGVLSVCCDKQEAGAASCFSKGGTICTVEEECSGGEQVSAAGTTSCCINGGECKYKSTVTIETNECEDALYTCKSSCASGETEMSLACSDETSVCCSAVAGPSYWWLWLLIILVILIALAIIYRNQLKVWWFKVQSKFKKGPVTPQARPQFGASQAQRPPMQAMPPAGARRFYPAPGAGATPPKREFGKERELDETMKKLRDMGK